MRLVSACCKMHNISAQGTTLVEDISGGKDINGGNVYFTEGNLLIDLSIYFLQPLLKTIYKSRHESFNFLFQNNNRNFQFLN